MTDATASRPEDTIAVVGAGISGLLLASALRARGESVIVLEKSRGMGGRLATKRVGNAVFDQGAQFFTAKDSRFSELVAHWQARGVVTHWPAAPVPRLSRRRPYANGCRPGLPVGPWISSALDGLSDGARVARLRELVVDEIHRRTLAATERSD